MAQKVLIVDDSSAVRLLISRALQGAGFETAEAVDGADGLARLSGETRFDVVICDVHMPNLNGLELLEQVPPAASDTPFVMLTTEAQPLMMKQARVNGAKAWLVKPLSPDVLIATVKRLSTLVV